MLPDLTGPALDLLAQYGLVVLFILLVLDNAGIPFPTELVLIVAVALFASDPFNLGVLLLVATAAALVGSFILYGVCYLGGRRLVEKRPKLFMMTPRRLERLERVFSRKSGMSLVFFLRLFPLTRVLVTIPAGIARMRPVAFLVLTFLGMAIYHVVLVYLAYRYGSAMDSPSLEAAASNPAWQYVQANQVLTILALLVLALVLSVRASRATFKDPQWASPSRIGWVAERLAVFGSLVLVALVLFDVDLVHRFLALGGLDFPALAERMDWEASSLLIMMAVVAFLSGLPVMLYGRAARRRKWAAWQVEHGLRGTAEVFEKPRSTTAAGQHLHAGRGPAHDQTLRSSPREGPGDGAGAQEEGSERKRKDGQRPRWDP